MRIKLLALDIDGTLLNSQHKLTPRTIQSVQRVVEAGVQVVLVTGRRFHAARPFAAELGLQLPLITHNGALTKNAETLEVINYHPLDGELARELVLLGRHYQADTLCCDDPVGEGFIVFDQISPENLRLRRYLDLYREYAREVSDLYSYIENAPIQIFYCGPCAPMDRLMQRLESELTDRAKLTVTTYPAGDMTILDVINPICSKGSGLEYLATSLNIVREEIMAIGDNRNDLEMLSYAGLPVVMENAEASLKGYGFVTTASNDADGVAEAIDRFIFQL
ncbi:MAG: Cof-type HAD-IIB family hydrolase [Acidobacteriota bacterium]